VRGRPLADKAEEIRLAREHRQTYVFAISNSLSGRTNEPAATQRLILRLRK
jgi:hypothetical protein